MVKIKKAIKKEVKKAPKTATKKPIKTEDKVEEDKKDVKVVSSQLKKKLEKQAKRQRPDRGVVFIKNLPHGFYEEQLKTYFQQFGRVTRVRVARSRKTTNSRGFAYIEFQYPEVAEIAAETMNNYMMFRKVLKTAYIPPDQQKFNYFRSGSLYLTDKDGKLVLTTRYRLKQQHLIDKHNRFLTTKELDKRKRGAQSKFQKLKTKLAKMNVDYDVDAVVPECYKKVGVHLQLQVVFTVFFLSIFFFQKG